MPAFHRSLLPAFLATSESELTGLLSVAYARSGFASQKTSQTLAWIADVLQLRSALAAVLDRSPEAASWSVLLEFPIPRKEKRIDVVLLAGETIVLLELKTSTGGSEAQRQAEEYALLLHYFHEPSHRRKIVPLVVTPSAEVWRDAPQLFLPIQEAPAFWITPVCQLAWDQLPNALCKLVQPSTLPIAAEAWDHGEYRPVPTIIDAALSLQAGLNIREIAHARAARYDVERLTGFIAKCVEEAQETKTNVICFVTGVPGSGKTLVGLNLAFSSKSQEHPIHFMSGTGPLVKVLQAAMAEHHRVRARVSAAESRMKAKTLIENVHVFASYYAEDNKERAPSNHIIIFDEAQRAWDRAQNFSKFRRPYSEPEMLLSIMERHGDWAAIIALVGGGQEINNGEAGLEEWGRALAASSKPWRVYASPEALEGGASVAGSRLFEAVPEHTLQLHAEPQLHLDVAVRSLHADSYSAWVNAVVLGQRAQAQDIARDAPFAVLLTRSVSDLRSILRENTLGESRCGLVASSAAARIRAEGLEPDSTFHGEYPWHHWYLAERTDVRSSYQLEVFATEFEIQGLELDWVGVCWGGDFIWAEDRQQWLCRSFAHKGNSAWSNLKNERRQTYRRNAYRVLLTRARQGVVIYVPGGDPADPTRSPEEFNETANFLLSCGARSAHVAPATLSEEVDSLTLFA